MITTGSPSLLNAEHQISFRIRVLIIRFSLKCSFARFSKSGNFLLRRPALARRCQTAVMIAARRQSYRKSDVAAFCPHHPRKRQNDAVPLKSREYHHQQQLVAVPNRAQVDGNSSRRPAIFGCRCMRISFDIPRRIPSPASTLLSPDRCHRLDGN